jgi:hypothetical protein
VLPNGQTYIDPQLAYFSDILDQIETKGATVGVEWKWNDDVTSNFNWFYIGETEVSTTFSNKAWFSGGSGETNHPGAPASFPGHRSDTALFNRRQRRGSVGHLPRQRRRNGDAV